MKLEIYLCDNCNKSINETEKYFYDLNYLQLCEKCKKEYDKFDKKWKEKYTEFINKHNEELKKDFPNLYKKLV